MIDFPLMKEIDNGLMPFNLRVCVCVCVCALEILRYGKGMERVSFHTHYVPPTYPKGISSDLCTTRYEPGMNQVWNRYEMVGRTSSVFLTIIDTFVRTRYGQFKRIGMEKVWKRYQYFY